MLRQAAEDEVPSSSSAPAWGGNKPPASLPSLPTAMKAARPRREDEEGDRAPAAEDAKRPRAVSPPLHHCVPLSPGSFSTQTGASPAPLGSPHIRSIYSLTAADEKRPRPRRERTGCKGCGGSSSGGGGGSRALCFDGERQGQVRELAQGGWFFFR